MVQGSYVEVSESHTTWQAPPNQRQYAIFLCISSAQCRICNLAGAKKKKKTGAELSSCLFLDCSSCQASLDMLWFGSDSQDRIATYVKQNVPHSGTFISNPEYGKTQRLEAEV